MNSFSFIYPLSITLEDMCRLYVIFVEIYVEMYCGTDEFQYLMGRVLKDVLLFIFLRFGIEIDVPEPAFIGLPLWVQSPLWFRGHLVAGRSFRIVACARHSGFFSWFSRLYFVV